MSLHLHPDDYLLFMKATIIARAAAEEFGLNLRSILPIPESEMKKEYERGVYGRCWTTQGIVHVAFRYQTDGRWLGRLPEFEIFDTVAHELAHLRYGDHGKSFWNFYREVKRFVDRRR